MRVFAISDIHIDFVENRKWFSTLSKSDYKDDILILAGDISDIIPMLEMGFEIAKKCFKEVLYIPGNHDLWVLRNREKDSFEKFSIIKKIAHNHGIRMKPCHFGLLSIIPLFGWYDYSFGEPSDEVSNIWVDYFACKWPNDFDELRITRFFTFINEKFLNIKNEFIISFSHFLPRIDIMPSFIPSDKRIIYPVLGSLLLEQQIRKLSSNIHIYGHSHLNLQTIKDNTFYINNAFGYPSETLISSRKLICIYEI